VQLLDSRLEIFHLSGDIRPMIESYVGRKKTDRMISPVIRQSHLFQVALRYGLLYRHQLDGRYAQVPEIAYQRRMRQRCISASYLLRDLRHQPGQPLYMRFIDDAVVISCLGTLLISPVVTVIDDGRLWRHGGIILLAIAEIILAYLISKKTIGPFHNAADGLRIRIQHYLIGVEPMPLRRPVGPMNPVTIQLTGTDVREIDMPYVV